MEIASVKIKGDFTAHILKYQQGLEYENEKKKKHLAGNRHDYYFMSGKRVFCSGTAVIKCCF